MEIFETTVGYLADNDVRDPVEIAFYPQIEVFATVAVNVQDHPDKIEWVRPDKLARTGSTVTFWAGGRRYEEHPSRPIVVREVTPS